jgi:nicotinamidase-related amidase
MPSFTSALLILDLLSPFDFPGGDALFEHARGAVHHVRSLRQRYRAARAPVILVNDNFSRWADDFDALVAYVRQSGPRGATMVEALSPMNDDFKLLKPRHSAFFETALPSLLRHLGVNRIVITGVATDSCVLSTALDACVRSIDVVVPSDTTASQSTERTSRTLLHLRETFSVATPPSKEIAP